MNMDADADGKVDWSNRSSLFFHTSRSDIVNGSREILMFWYLQIVDVQCGVGYV